MPCTIASLQPALLAQLIPKVREWLTDENPTLLSMYCNRTFIIPNGSILIEQSI